jgi:hypothetical protein
MGGKSRYSLTSWKSWGCSIRTRARSVTSPSQGRKMDLAPQWAWASTTWPRNAPWPTHRRATPRPQRALGRLPLVPRCVLWCSPRLGSTCLLRNHRLSQAFPRMVEATQPRDNNYCDGGHGGYIGALGGRTTKLPTPIVVRPMTGADHRGSLVWEMDIPQVPMNIKTCHGSPGRFSPRSSYGMGQLNVATLGRPGLSRQKPTPELSAIGARTYRPPQF